MLSEQQLARARTLIASKAPGLYVLRELLSEDWDLVYRPRAYGQWFRRAVRREDLPGVRWVRKRSDNCHVYEVVLKT